MSVVLSCSGSVVIVTFDGAAVPSCVSGSWLSVELPVINEPPSVADTLSVAWGVVAVWACVWGVRRLASVLHPRGTDS